MLDTVIQVGDILDLIGALGPKRFVVLAIAYFLYQIYSPKQLPDTKFQKIIHQFEEQIESIQQNVTTKLDTFGQKQLAHIQITRAIASVNNPADEIDDAIVDDYLIKNGIDKDDFLRNNKSRRSTKGFQFDNEDARKMSELMYSLEREDEDDSKDNK